MENTLTAIIVEDEYSGRTTLKNMLEKYCENVKVAAMAENVDEAIKAINAEKPDIVFLDIELPEKSGFELLQFYSKPDFDIVFTTAYDKYAIKAFKFAASDYLLKPIDLEELRNTVARSRNRKKNAWQVEKMNVLKENLNNHLQKLSLPTSDGFIFVEIEHIIRCEADGNYTKFYLDSGEQHLIARTLKYYEDLLNDFNFYRINRSDLINLNHLRKFSRQKKSIVTMSDGANLSLVDSRKEDFLQKIEQD